MNVLILNQIKIVSLVDVFEMCFIFFRFIKYVMDFDLINHWSENHQKLKKQFHLEGLNNRNANKISNLNVFKFSPSIFKQVIASE
jgi:hypothetical protein